MLGHLLVQLGSVGGLGINEEHLAVSHLNLGMSGRYFLVFVQTDTLLFEQLSCGSSHLEDIFSVLQIAREHWSWCKQHD